MDSAKGLLYEYTGSGVDFTSAEDVELTIVHEFLHSLRIHEPFVQAFRFVKDNRHNLVLVHEYGVLLLVDEFYTLLEAYEGVTLVSVRLKSDRLTFLNGLLVRFNQFAVEEYDTAICRFDNNGEREEFKFREGSGEGQVLRDNDITLQFVAAIRPSYEFVVRYFVESRRACQ